MLTESDIEWIKGNRKEIEQNRTDTLILYHETAGEEINPRRSYSERSRRRNDRSYV